MSPSIAFPSTVSFTALPLPSRRTVMWYDHAAEASHGSEARPALRNRRRDVQAVVGRTDPENPLRDGIVVPGRRAGEPGILGFAVRRARRGRRSSARTHTARSGGHR